MKCRSCKKEYAINVFAPGQCPVALPYCPNCLGHSLPAAAPIPDNPLFRKRVRKPGLKPELNEPKKLKLVRVNILDPYLKHQRQLEEEVRKEKTRKASKAWARRQKKLLHEYVFQYLLDHPCIDCGESDPLVLEFDHIDPVNKKADICKLVTTNSRLSKVKKEIKKCEVRCANCHKRRTARQTNNWKLNFQS